MRINNYLVLLGFLLLDGSGCFSSVQAENIEDLIGSFIEVAVGQHPSNENGDDSQFKDRALNDKSNDEIYDSTSQAIIERSGYNQTTYQVVSDDGYITQLINIINPLTDRSQLKQPPVMLFHGGLVDSSCWIWANAIQHHPEKYPRVAEDDGPITSFNRSLAFMLANNGYDVWLVGTRGSNKQNLGHINYRAKLFDELLEEFITDDDNQSVHSSAQEFIDTIRYFDYSMDELVEYEYPKQIEAVLQLTGSEKVSIVGLSFGTPIMFKILSSNKKLSRQIHSYVALLPILKLDGSNKVIKAIAELVPNVPTPLGTVLIQLILSKPVRHFLRKLKRYETFKLLTSLVFGSSPKYLTFLEEPVIGHLLLSTGFKEIQHFAQGIKVAKLQNFDYGRMKNVHMYGNFTPPDYDLSQFKTENWMIVTGANDVLGTLSSGDQYVDMITKVKPYTHLTIDNYNHLDMVAAFDNDVQVNLPILEFFDELSYSAENDQQPTDY